MGSMDTCVHIGFPGSSASKESPCNAGDPSLMPGLGNTLETGTGTHSSVLAWRIPQTEEPGGLQSMGLQRVGRDCSDLAQQGDDLDLGERAASVG